MRIYIDARSLTARPSGIGQYARNLIREMVRQAPHHEWHVLRHASNRDPIVDSSPRSYREHYDDKKHGRWDEFLLGAAKLHELFRTWGAPELYHNLYHISPIGLSHFGPYTPREVVTLHDLIQLDYPLQTNPNQVEARAMQAYVRVAIPHTLARADHVICVSETTRTRATAWLSPGRSSVIHHGIQRDYFEPQPAPDFAAHDLGDEPYIIAVGNDKPYKNLSVLVQAFADAYEKLERGRLVLVGSCDALREEIARTGLDREIWTPGFLPEEQLKSLIAHADLFVFPSLIEGFGLPPLEAMALGAPTSVSDRAPMTELVGEAALRFHPESPSALARQIDRVMRRDRLRRSLRAKGKQRAEHFTWERAARQTLEVYAEVLER